MLVDSPPVDAAFTRLHSRRSLLLDHNVKREIGINTLDTGSFILNTVSAYVKRFRVGFVQEFSNEKVESFKTIYQLKISEISSLESIHDNIQYAY